MRWAINHDVTHYISSGVECTDTDAPISPGESVQIRKGDNEFKTLVDSVEDDHFKGTILTIGSIPTLEDQETSRGQKITFNQMNMFCVYRIGGAV